MTWMRYLLEANIYLCLFYLLYRLLLSRETHYNLNRGYLLFSCIIAFILPMLQLGFLKPTEPQVNITVVQMPVNGIAIAAKPVQVAPLPHFSWQDGLIYIYFAGVLIFAVLLLVKLARLLLLTRKPSPAHDSAYKLIEIDGSATAFSFFSIIFIGAETRNRETIIRHEMVHVSQKHSADILLLELLRIINWLNPVVYLLQNSLKAVHEYIADEKTASVEIDNFAYSTFLVDNAYGIGGPSLAHSFFNKNLLKQRIIMLHQKRSGNLARLKYLLTLPVCAGLLCISTLAFSKTYGWIDLAPGKASPFASNTLVHRSNADTNKSKRKSTYTYNNSNTTGKGYAYKESGYLINGKTDFRVIITEKNGEQKSYFRDNATPVEIKMLRDKYGYTFPSMELFAKLPPPPPAPAAPKNGPVAPPPPPQPPKRPAKLKRLPPPVVIPTDTSASVQINEPQKILINYYNDTAKTVGRAGEVKATYEPRLISGLVTIPMIMVNGVRYKIAAALKPGERLYITGSDSTAWYSPGDARAKKKWGADAANGVYDLHGKPSITIR
jgi:hypothetical protein